MDKKTNRTPRQVGSVEASLLYAMRANLVPLLLLSVTTISYARTWMISVGASLQTVVDSSARGDSIILEDGHYYETVLIHNKNLTIGSRYLLDSDTCHAAVTIIEPSLTIPDTESCFVATNNDTGAVRIVGMTLINGLGSLFRYRNNLLVGGGGAILAIECDLEVEWCVFQDCLAEMGGAILCGSTRSDFRRFYRVSNCSFRGCSTDSYGGGIHSVQVRGRLENSIFHQCSSLGTGGGVNCFNAELIIQGSTFDSISTDYGAVFVGGALAQITNTEFSHNSAVDGGICDLMLANSRVRVRQSIFRDNLTSEHSIQFDHCQGDGIAFEQNQMLRNRAIFHTGNILISWSSLIFKHNLFADNVSGGGALFTIFGTPGYTQIRHNIILNCQEQFPTYGSVISDQTYQQTIMDSNFISGNAAPVVSGVGQTHLPFNCLNNWWGHPSGPYHAELNPTGQGDTLIGDDCDFIPWLTEPPDTSGWLPAISHERIPLAKSWQIAAIYPNPFNSSVTISLEGATNSDFELSLHNLLGQKVDTIRQGFTRGETIHYSAPPNMSSGVYFLVARDRSAMDTKKLVLLR